LPAPEVKDKKSKFEKRYNTENKSDADVLGDTIFIGLENANDKPQ